MNNTVLIIQPPAGTIAALTMTGLVLPFNVTQIGRENNIDNIIRRIKNQQYRFIINGLTWDGDLEIGLEFIDKLLKNNIDFLKTIVILYTYEGLVKDLDIFIKEKGIILPDNWYIVTKETTYYYEHEALLKKIKELTNR